MIALASSFVPIIIALVIIAGIGLGSYYFSSKKVILRALAKIPHKTMGSIRTNELVKISGKALHANEPLKAPLSKRDCVFYSITIEQKKSSGKHSHWKTLIHDEQFHDFFVDHRGEMVMIKPSHTPKNYVTYLVPDKNTASGMFNNPTPEFEALLKRYHIESSNFFGFNKQLRYSEGIIEVGERITVSGIAKWKSFTEPIEGFPYSKILSLESEGKQKLIISDLPEALESRP
ncbi:hypothetical protein [Mangrovimonas xylaniphaga]|uniref:hypothetical protein n=1 Tax=Mangrovimonas xylaniphaga TaxID=1645915 RepID=UPI0006B4F02E|nr:hypothetical protein [Mangrovimonas xylaniphaga]